MAQVYTFTDANGEVRLMAEINPAPGGAQPVITRELFAPVTATTINDSAAALLTWDGATGPDALLSLVAPTQPTAVTTGVYAVAVTVAAQASMTVGGYFLVQLEMNRSDEDATVSAESEAASAVRPTPRAFIASTYYLPAGADIGVRVTNLDGVQAIDYAMTSAVVQRIS